MKLSGVISQGLLGPLSWLTSRGIEDVAKYQLNDNVETEMGVTKFIHEEESHQYGAFTKFPQFPMYVPKTDSMRQQFDPTYYFDNIRDKEIVITRKEDGCPSTFIFKDGEFTLCGRNFCWTQEEGNNVHYYKMESKYDLKNKLTVLNRNIAVQGEIVGPKVSGNRLKVADLQWRCLTSTTSIDRCT